VGGLEPARSRLVMSRLYVKFETHWVSGATRG